MKLCPSCGCRLYRALGRTDQWVCSDPDCGTVVREKYMNESLRKYRRTPKGLLTYLYHKQKERSQNRGWPPPDYTLEELHVKFLNNNRYLDIFNNWVEHGFNSADKPSLDRISPLEPYTITNLQVLTALQNRLKGDREKIILWGSPVIQFELKLVEVARYKSVKEAARKTSISPHNISTVACGRRLSAGGYTWKYM